MENYCYDGNYYVFILFKNECGKVKNIFINKIILINNKI